MFNGEDKVQVVLELDDHAGAHLRGGNRHKGKLLNCVGLAGTGENGPTFQLYRGNCCGKKMQELGYFCWDLFFS
jgi:hypothetical protein